MAGASTAPLAWAAVPAGGRIVEIAAVAFKHGLDWGSALLFITTLKFVNLLNLRFVMNLLNLQFVFVHFFKVVIGVVLEPLKSEMIRHTAGALTISNATAGP